MTSAETVSDAARSIILAAVQAAGPVRPGVDPNDPSGLTGWQVQVQERAADITAMLSTHSPVAQLVAAMQAAKVFVGVVHDVTKERSSTRGLVTLFTTVDEKRGRPDGLETVRTERTDGDPAARALANRLRGLIGHKVRVYVEVQTMTSDPSRKSRVIKHVEDLGPVVDGDPYLQHHRAAAA